MISAHFPFIVAEYVAIGNGGAVGGRVVVDEVENAVLVLDIHRQTLQTISQLARNGFAVKAAHLLEIGELRHFHAVAPYFPAKAPCAKRRAFPIVFDKTDVVEQRINANGPQRTEI